MSTSWRRSTVLLSIRNMKPVWMSLKVSDALLS
ncbi:unnamed protein product, partial [Haemonchus placei]|uniref:Uncharacterized protein n=1 Tax=Haemonchus placei TaxID=6290 RepID=A0A0N4VZH8_HAEPC